MKFKNLFIVIATLLSFLQANAYGFSAYSNAELDQLEKEFKQTINQSPLVIRNPLAKNYINQLAAKLSQHAQMDKPYFFIVKSSEINAFAGPGGYIGVNTQLILASDTESELAAVMAHEMAHVRLHHLYRMIEHQKQMKIPQLAGLLAAAALGVINPVLGTGALMGAMSGFQQDSINFVRSNEKEADNIGINILARANLDPNGMPNFFKKMQENMRYYYTDNIPAILRTHPLDEDRIAEAQNRISQLAQRSSSGSSNDYYYFKELIRHEVKHDPQKLLEYYQKMCFKYAPTFACQYGLSLSYLELNQTEKAKALLEAQAATENPFLNLALAQAEQNSGHPTAADNIYQKFYAESPDNTAVINQYSEFLNNQENNPQKALALLTKAHRKMKQDLGICLKLARVQAKLHKTAEAYFTEADCQLIQGERRKALDLLRTAKRYASGNHYMQQRIDAKIDEVKDSLNDLKS
jgi:predicted Zn-dependent protease